jgi:hypothetical protein
LISKGLDLTHFGGIIEASKGIDLRHQGLIINMAKKATNCIDCDYLLINDPKAFGKRCYECKKKYLNTYYILNKERIDEMNKANRLANHVPKEKVSRKKFTDEENRIRIKNRIGKSNMKNKVRKYIAEIITRGPTTPNPDREVYINNKWMIPLYHLDFTSIEACPMEYFDISYWEQLEMDTLSSMSEYINKRNYERFLDDAARAKSSYCKPDKEYGELSTGGIRFYPT